MLGLYLPPVSNVLPLSPPPQTIISLPVQTAVCPARSLGALVVLVAVQLSVPGLYLPPVLPAVPAPDNHFSVGPHCPGTQSGRGSVVRAGGFQLSALGLYLPPVLVKPLNTRDRCIRPIQSFRCQPTLPCAPIDQMAR